MWNYIKVHASKISIASACLQGDFKLRRSPNNHNVETLTSNTTCDVPKPWDKAKGAKIKNNLSLSTTDR